MPDKGRFVTRGVIHVSIGEHCKVIPKNGCSISNELRVDELLKLLFEGEESHRELRVHNKLFVV